MHFDLHPEMIATIAEGCQLIFALTLILSLYRRGMRQKRFFDKLRMSGKLGSDSSTGSE
jgi:hypothetical protein